ncbi:hypothetical protein B0H14DRAFT_3874252 [Mycena olivaceomarginata]|nr:hypothetical protein B0H14DRAFT_3874252 [Mycena olivaceomarginata]
MPRKAAAADGESAPAGEPRRSTRIKDLPKAPDVPNGEEAADEADGEPAAKKTKPTSKAAPGSKPASKAASVKPASKAKPASKPASKASVKPASRAGSKKPASKADAAAPASAAAAWARPSQRSPRRRPRRVRSNHPTAPPTRTHPRPCVPHPPRSPPSTRLGSTRYRYLLLVIPYLSSPLYSSSRHLVLYVCTSPYTCIPSVPSLSLSFPPTFSQNVSKRYIISS